MNPLDSIKQQYERFPYPPVSSLALPQKGQGQNLRYEFGHQLAYGTETSHAGIRILVAGCGTLEALLVAQNHPLAREIIAVDLSEKSLQSLRRRIILSRISRPTHRLPPIRLICSDLHLPLNLDTPLDLIIASNVLHHSPHPEKMLETLSSQLKPNGLLRLVTYPKSSRIWMRETAKFLKWSGLTPKTPKLRYRATQCIKSLPQDHPVRACFESQPETATEVGLVDAFFHCCENPLAPLEWQHWSETFGLSLVGECQTETSRSEFLDELAPELRSMDRWSKLQVLDDLLEICANPVLWFKKALPAPEVEENSGSYSNEFGSEFKDLRGNVIHLPSPIFWELKQNLVRIEALMADHSKTAPLREGSSLRQGTPPTYPIPLETLLHRLEHHVGPRVDPKDPDRPLPGLALYQYSLKDILNAKPPIPGEFWDTLQAKHGHHLRFRPLDHPELAILGSSLRENAEYLQLRLGPFESQIRVQIV